MLAIAQHVVILGSGAFGLEAMEAAHKAGARSIIMLTRARDRCAVQCKLMTIRPPVHALIFLAGMSPM